MQKVDTRGERDNEARRDATGARRIDKGFVTDLVIHFNLVLLNLPRLTVDLLARRMMKDE